MLRLGARHFHSLTSPKSKTLRLVFCIHAHMYCLTLLLFISYIISNLPTVIPCSSFVFMSVYYICICVFQVDILLMLLLEMQCKSFFSFLLPAQIMAIITLHTFFMVAALYRYNQSESLRSTVRISDILNNNILQICFIL